MSRSADRADPDAGAPDGWTTGGPAESGRPARGTAALAGVLAGALALALTELMAGEVRRVPSLVGAVGDVVVDHLPHPPGR